jgi:hypothetical protein
MLRLLVLEEITLLNETHCSDEQLFLRDSTQEPCYAQTLDLPYRARHLPNSSSNPGRGRRQNAPLLATSPKLSLARVLSAALLEFPLLRILSLSVSG